MFQAREISIFPTPVSSSVSSLQSFIMNAFLLHLLPFVKGCVAATFMAVLLRVAMLRFRQRQRRKSDQKHYKNPEAMEIYGLKSIPQLKPSFPIIGNFPLLVPLKDLFKNGLRWCEEYGDIFRFCGLNQTFVILNSAELVQTLLKSGDFGHITKSPLIYKQLKPFITNGVIVSEGHFWQGQRKILMKSQSFSNLKAYMEMLNKHGRKIVKYLGELYEDEEPKPANFLISRTFLCVISEMITGYDGESNEEMDRYHHILQIWKEVVITRISKPWLLLDFVWGWSALKKKYDKVVEEMFEFSRRRLEKFKLDRKHTCSNNGGGGSDKGNNYKSSVFRSVLDELVDAGVDDEQILDEVNVLLFAGHESVAGAIQALCFTMALNPEIQAKCQEEIDVLFEEKGDITFEDVQGGLKYLERCILETLRLFPPIFVFVRQLQSPLNLVHEGRNIVLPSGTNAVVSPICLHWKPEYFPEPSVFNPDRFLAEEVAKRSAYAFIPFSAGPRNCLGMKFAMMEMKTIAAHMLHNFEITTTDKMEDISLLPHVTLTPETDYIFMFKKRV